MNLNELITRYEQRLNDNKAYSQYNKNIDMPNELENGKVEAYKEILQDLKQLKEYITQLITFLPSEEKTRILDETIYTEYRIYDSDFKEIIGE